MDAICSTCRCGCPGGTRKDHQEKEKEDNDERGGGNAAVATAISVTLDRVCVWLVAFIAVITAHLCCPCLHFRIRRRRKICTAQSQ